MMINRQSCPDSDCNIYKYHDRINMAGGEGKVLYTMVGALIIGSLRNVLNLLHVSVYMQTLIVGIVLIGVVAFSMLMKARREARTSQFAAAEADVH